MFGVDLDFVEGVVVFWVVFEECSGLAGSFGGVVVFAVFCELDELVGSLPAFFDGVGVLGGWFVGFFVCYFALGCCCHGYFLSGNGVIGETELSR